MRYTNVDVNAEPSYFTVNRGQAPRPLNFRGRNSSWRDRFESMEPQEWFIVPNKDRWKTASAAVKYLKGRHTFYRINQNGDYCLLKIR